MADTKGQRHLRVHEVVEGVVVAQFDGENHGLVGADQAAQLFDLVQRADKDPHLRAVIFTGSHPTRFISHADVSWLQERGAAVPPFGRFVASIIARVAHFVRKHQWLYRLSLLTPLGGPLQLETLHESLTRMNRSGTIFIAAMNGSALGLGAEIAWACDLRLMAEGDYFIGHPEVLLGFAPGAGGTQRLSRLIGAHRALLAILEGAPVPAKQALELGVIDELIAPDLLMDRAIELGVRLASRREEAVRAIKRSVYLGSAMSLEEGLHVERTEFLTSLTQRQAQELMIAYLRDTEENGELGLYRPAAYATALQLGTVPTATTAGTSR
jgi:enoyl-CoA hydratase